ncbi:hypothetical protein ACHAWF_009485 [Thalassiosira exigua]
MQQPSIQPAPSAGSASLAYSMSTDATPTDGGGGGGGRQRAREELPPRDGGSGRGNASPDAEGGSDGERAAAEGAASGEMSAEQYYDHAGQYNRYQELHSGDEALRDVGEQLPSTGGGARDGDPDAIPDATATVHSMHRRLLVLLSRPELFAEAMEWQSKVDRGLDPSKPEEESEGGGGNGIRSFDDEFEEQSRTTAAADERKEEVDTVDGSAAAEGDREGGGGEGDANSKYKDQNKLVPPLPLQIFAPDAEVVLPQALTASQLFGMERVTGIELEAAAGMTGLSQLFLRWLAIMPEGDHCNVVDPPGLTVMRISGGRYRVTGAHRVVWRWMNKFSPAKVFAVPDVKDHTLEEGGLGRAAGGGGAEAEDDDGSNAPDTDFDFGDLVAMTIVDVFETDADGKLLSYCPTFDNRAVHKTREAVERVRKGASHLKERMEVVARSPAGKSVNKAAENLGKMALNVGHIVRSKIEEEIHKHQHHGEEEDKGAIGSGEGEEDEEGTAAGGGGGGGESSAAAPKGASAAHKGEAYVAPASPS